ncbi:MAG: acylase [Saprospiraceae bacterium]|nr:acylase [Saprospiraceae bacterium]
MKVLVLLFLVSVIVFASCKTEVKSPEEQRWDQHVKNVEIIRDGFGVPHIYGNTDADAVFGLLYAQCEDDFARVERNYIWAIGRLAEVEGEEALYSDLRAHLFMTRSEAEAHLQASPPWLRKLCTAFADGINYYLHTHPEVTPALLTRFEPWMPMYFSEGSIGGDIERVRTSGIKAFYQNPQVPAEALGYAPLEIDHDEEPRGSNGIAIAGQHTASGDAMLLINPHTSFYFRGEVHAVSEEGLNAYGAVTWGQFFIYQGFNEKTGWMHTSTYTDVIDEFVEDVQRRDGRLMYEYGNEWREVEEDSVALQFVQPNGTMVRRHFPIYRTHHGPITRMENDHWIATSMMWEPVKALEQSYTRTKLSGHNEFHEMMNIRTNSSNNTVYADAGGNIAYYHGNFIPRRNEAFDYTAPVEGDNPLTDWQGLHPVDESIVVVNPPNGWLQNCNSTPFTCAGPNSPKASDYPAYMSLNRENHRGLHAVRLLEKIEDMTLDKLIELAYSPLVPGFEDLIPGLLDALDRSPGSAGKYQAAAETLRKWDFTTSTTSIAMTLAHYYGTAYQQHGQAPEGLSRMQRINHFAQESPLQERIEIFNRAMTNLEEDFGDWKTPWGEVNRFQRLSGDIKPHFDDQAPSLPVGLASGRWGALASYGARQYDTKRIYGTSGNSFVAVVEFGDRVVAKSLLAGGQSGDPNSPHFYDQAQPYIDVNFKDVLYYREDVEKGAKETYLPGKR